MRKYLLVVLSCLCLLGLIGCMGKTGGVAVQEYTSDIYTEQEIESAIEVTKSYFRLHFAGCTLTEISYAGDEYTKDYMDWAERNGADDVIVLISSFDVGPSGGDGSLNPNTTYSNWNWILVRDEGGKWKHADHGY